MTDGVDVFASPSPPGGASRSGFAPGEIATLTCDRCKQQQLPWELRRFGDRAICRACFEATLDLARGAIRAAPTNEPGRLCRNCRAMQDPSVGSAWCSVIELGDERARICENFVPARLEAVRGEITGGRTRLLDLWQAAGDELKQSLGEGGYRTWLAQIEPVSLEGSQLVLAVPDAYTRDWLEQRLLPAIRSALAVCGRPDVEPTFLVEQREDHPEEPPASSTDRPHVRAGFNAHYRFAEFIVGSGNRLAHASALACVDKPGRAYNPLILYGGVGVGKTHLLQAIGQEAMNQREVVALYVTSETFTNELIQAIHDGSTGTFRERYRSLDYLLLDDVQFIAGKEATQEEFFHTFNALHQAGKQIVITCDRPPGELKVLEPRLRSRFAWGLMADMQPPDLETRMAIVRSKAALRGRRLHETVLNALGSRAASNVRELEGALNRVLALADLLGTEPNMEIVRTVLGDPDTDPGSCSPSDVLQAVSSYYRVKTSDLSGPQRDRRVAYARQMAMFLLREDAKLSLIDVGNHLGGRNHSTVIYGCEKIAKEFKRKSRVKQDVQAIKQLMYGVR